MRSLIEDDPNQGCLLDTHQAIWALREPERLSKRTRDALLARNCFLSVVTFWEVTIKSMKGKIDVGDPRAWWNDALAQLAARPLSLSPDHVTALSGLPPIHRDPFDRILIAQAMVERLRLVSADAKVRRYRSARLRVVS